jgi:hypothetical protein
MNNAQQLIEQLRRKVPRHTNYAIAKALEMTPSQLARVIDGKHGLGPKAVVRLHELLGRDALDLLVLIEEDKAKTPADKDFWSRRSPRITASVALAALAFGLAVTGQDVHAAALYTNTVLTRHLIHYANLKPWGCLKVTAHVGATESTNQSRCR